MHYFYCRTFDDYGNHPALTLAFFRHLATTMPRQLVLFLAERDGEAVAGALCLRGGDTLYGRYWGVRVKPSPGLHFESCYYQGIDYCLREGLQVLRTRRPGRAQDRPRLSAGDHPQPPLRWPNRPSRRRVADWCPQERAATASTASGAGPQPLSRADELA